jgi:hypothetical protein
MEIETKLLEFARRGITVAVVNGEKVRAEGDALTDEDAEWLRSNKPALLTLDLLKHSSPVDWPSLKACPVCASRLVKSESDGWRYSECRTDPAHFARLTSKRKDAASEQDPFWHCTGCSLPPSDKPFVIYSE